MDYKDQLSDSGAVIGYAPDIRMPEKAAPPGKVNNASGSIIYLSDRDRYEGMPKAVAGYLKAMPGDTASRLGDVMDACDDIVGSLAEEFNTMSFPRQWDAWRLIAEAENGGADFVKSFIDTFDHAGGSIIPQVIQVVTSEKSFLKKLMDDYVSLYYGKGTTIKSAKEKDAELSARIRSSALAGSGADLMLIAKDAELSHMVDIFSYDAEDCVMNIGDCPFLEADGTFTDEALMGQVGSMYAGLSKSQDARQAMYERQHVGMDDWAKASRHYASLRHGASVLCKGLGTGMVQSEFLAMKSQERIDMLDSALAEAYKPLAANIFHLQKVHGFMCEKQKLNALVASSGYT